MHYIDDRLRKAFQRLKLHHLTNAETGKHLGCSSKHVGRIVRGQVGHLSDETWKKFEPKLKPYLDETPFQMDAPIDPKRKFIADNLSLLSDEEVTKLVVEIIEKGGSLQIS
jgi:hypothetical protein